MPAYYTLPITIPCPRGQAVAVDAHSDPAWSWHISVLHAFLFSLHAVHRPLRKCNLYSRIPREFATANHVCCRAERNLLSPVILAPIAALRQAGRVDCVIQSVDKTMRAEFLASIPTPPKLYLMMERLSVSGHRNVHRPRRPPCNPVTTCDCETRRTTSLRKAPRQRASLRAREVQALPHPTSRAVQDDRPRQAPLSLLRLSGRVAGTCATHLHGT